MLSKYKKFIVSQVNLDPNTLEFFAHSKNYLSANLLIKALGLISVPIYTNFLSTYNYGVLSIFQVASGLLLILLSALVSGGIYRGYFEEDLNFKEFLGSNLIFSILTSILLILIITIFSDFFTEFFGISKYLLMLAIMSAFFLSIFNIYSRLLQAKKKSKTYSKITIFHSVALLVVSVTLMYFITEEIRYFGSIYGGIIVGALLFIYASYHLLKESKLTIKFEHIKYSLVFGIPLIPNAFAGFFLSFFDKIIIGQLTNLESVGVYSLAYNIGITLTVIIAAMTATWTPIFFEQMKKNNTSHLIELAKKLTKIILFFAFGIIIASKYFILFLTPTQYHSGIPIVQIVVIGYIFFFIYSIYSLYSQYHKKTIFITINTFIALTINIALNYLFIPEYGIIVAAYSTAISFAVMAGLHYLVVRFILKEKLYIPLKIFAKPLSLFAIVLAIKVLINFSMANQVLTILLEIMLIILLAGLYFLGTTKKIFKRFLK